MDTSCCQKKCKGAIPDLGGHQLLSKEMQRPAKTIHIYIYSMYVQHAVDESEDFTIHTVVKARITVGESENFTIHTVVKARITVGESETTHGCA